MKKIKAPWKIFIIKELSWNRTFESSQDQLAILAKEAAKEYQSGETNDEDW